MIPEYLGPGVHFSKVPKTFRPRKAICDNMNNSFYKAVILTYLNSVNCDRPGECSPEKDCLR